MAASPWPSKSFFLRPASSMARRAAHARYSAVDLRGSPGLLPSRSVGVSPMPTIAVFPQILIMILHPYFFTTDSSAKVGCQGKRVHLYSHLDNYVCSRR